MIMNIKSVAYQQEFEKALYDKLTNKSEMETVFDDVREVQYHTNQIKKIHNKYSLIKI